MKPVVVDLERLYIYAKENAIDLWPEINRETHLLLALKHAGGAALNHRPFESLASSSLAWTVIHLMTALQDITDEDELGKLSYVNPTNQELAEAGGPLATVMVVRRIAQAICNQHLYPDTVQLIFDVSSIVRIIANIPLPNITERVTDRLGIIE